MAREKIHRHFFVTPKVPGVGMHYIQQGDGPGARWLTEDGNWTKDSPKAKPFKKRTWAESFLTQWEKKERIAA
jgi:hypothetical protein